MEERADLDGETGALPEIAKCGHVDGSGKGVAVELPILSSPAPAGMPVSVKLPSVAVVVLQRRWGILKAW